MPNTALIDEVREVRRKIAAQCDNDLDKITRYAEHIAADLGFKVPVQHRA